jgi:small subunit ribosomal protein S2
MHELPGALFIIDSTKEEIAILEAQKLRIPIVAIVDTNGDPENINHPIPGNDDAVRAIELFASKVAQAIMEGKQKRMETELQEAKKEEVAEPEGEQAISEQQAGTAPESKSSEGGEGGSAEPSESA